jgi:hypothetical protein
MECGATIVCKLLHVNCLHYAKATAGYEPEQSRFLVNALFRAGLQRGWNVEPFRHFVGSTRSGDRTCGKRLVASPVLGPISNAGRKLQTRYRMCLGGVRTHVGVSACQRKLVGEASSFARFLRSKAGRFAYMDFATSQATPLQSPGSPIRRYADTASFVLAATPHCGLLWKFSLLFSLRPRLRT